MSAKKKKLFKRTALIGVGLFLLAVFTFGVAIAEKPERNNLAKMRVAAHGDVTNAVIATTIAPTYTVFKLKAPDRLIIDVAGGDVAALEAPMEYGKGHLVNFTTASFDNAGRKIGRMIFGMTQGATYDIVATDDSLSIAFKGKLIAERIPENGGVKNTALAKKEETTIIRLIENAPVTLKSVKVTGLRNSPKITLETVPPTETFELLELDNPPRIVIDIPNGIKPKSLRKHKVKHPAVKSVRFGEYEDKLRVVLDIAPKMEFVAKVEPWQKNLVFSLKH